MKICVSCKNSLDEIMFSKDKTKKDGLNNTCKECRNKISKKSYLKNREKILLKSIIKNKTEERKIYKKEWFQNFKNNNQEEYKKRYTKSLNKQSYKAYKKEWYQKNKKKIQKNIIEKRKTNYKLAISHSIGNAIRKSLGKNKMSKHWEIIIGYNLKQLIERLEKTTPEGFSLEDYSLGKLHIDHIIPIKLYNYKNYEDEEFKKCWNYRNLRFTTSFENLSKGDKLDKNLIIEYNIIDLLPKEVLFENI